MGPYIIIQLQRFKVGPYGIQKIHTHVRGEDTIHIQGVQYELHAIINHDGEYDAGHYTTLVKHKIGAKTVWVLLDDDRPPQIMPELHVSSNFNYMFLYKRSNGSLNEPIESLANQDVPELEKRTYASIVGKSLVKPSQALGQTT